MCKLTYKKLKLNLYWDQWIEPPKLGLNQMIDNSIDQSNDQFVSLKENWNERLKQS